MRLIYCEQNRINFKIRLKLRWTFSGDVRCEPNPLLVAFFCSDVFAAFNVCTVFRNAHTNNIRCLLFSQYVHRHPQLSCLATKLHRLESRCSPIVFANILLKYWASLSEIFPSSSPYTLCPWVSISSQTVLL